MPHSPEYSGMWEALRRWAEYEHEAASGEADDASEESDSSYSRGEQLPP